MKLAKFIGVASAAIVSSAFAGEVVPSTASYFKVKLTADVTVQDDEDSTSNVRLDTGDVIEALLDVLGTPSSNPQHFDIIAAYEVEAGAAGDLLDGAVYYLARTRGPAAARYKVEIPSDFFGTFGGAETTVGKFVFNERNSTLKSNITSAFAGVDLITDELVIEAQGLAKAQVTVKGLDDEDDASLSALKVKFTGHQATDLGEAGFGVGSITANIGGAFKASTFDALDELEYEEPVIIDEPVVVAD